ncbi:MAG: hypothetical protein CBC09_01345 [Cellvibrionales bacterium TMED49]|nr:hypothetical protein [Porticoccaceae bacterium]OUU39840.1 MAG: hypothetical protein CBC09_01345 [Cellvibrionales bacterium TMED49]
MSTHFDLCIIGGGIIGAGIAQAAAINGLSTIIVEKRGWGAGNSSKSSKIIDGDFEGIPHLRFSNVRERLRERRIIRDIAPSIQKVDWFYLPIYKQNVQKSWQIALQLRIYDALAGRNNLASSRNLPEKRWRSLYGLNQHDLSAVYAIQEIHIDDTQLAQNVLRSAKQHGAMALCPVNFEGARQSDDGYIVSVAKGSRNRNFDCRFLVNATGAWGDRVSRSIEGVKNPLPTRVIKSTHIEFREHLCDNSFYVEGRNASNRIAILPWRGGTLVGSVDSMFSGNPERVAPSTEEVEYLVKVTRHHFPHFQYEPFDAWSGLRLTSVKQRAILSRKYRKLDDTEERYLCVRESQFASYRATAERVVISVMRSLSEKSAPPPETHYICSSSVRI